MIKIYLFFGGLMLVYGCSFTNRIPENKKLVELSFTKANSFYKGIPVIHRFNEPIDKITAYKNFEDILKQKSKQNNLNFKISIKDIPQRFIVETVDRLLQEFPFMIENDDLKDKISILKADFPTLTDSEILKNSKIIEDYYYKNLDVRVAEKLTKEEVNLETDSRKNDEVFTCLKNKRLFKDYGRSFGSYAMAVYAFYKASDQAKRYSSNVFSDLNETDTKRDAYRHVLWSALLCSNYYTVISKDSKLAFAKAAGNVNEKCVENKSDARAMDFHNNIIGRKLYHLNAPHKNLLGELRGFEIPSVDLLRLKTQKAINNAVYVKEAAPNLTASKIQSGKFSCTVTNSKKEGFVWKDNHTAYNHRNQMSEPSFSGYFWETNYNTVENCYRNKVVYIRRK